jgi:hypothetical protein
MRRRRPASVSTIAKAHTGSKSCVVLFAKENARCKQIMRSSPTEQSTNSRLLRQAMLSFIVDVEVLLS